jgi:CSLREA domain-containing protein
MVMVLRQLIRSAAVGVLLLSAAPAFADYVVTTDSDADNASDGVCSLREAITAVNNQATYNECTSLNAGESAVSFNIAPGLGEVHVIELASALPKITHFITIDGTTQIGAWCTPVPNVRIQITNPTNLATDGLMLDAGSDLSDIRGLAISGFATSLKAGLNISSNDVRVGCVLSGTNASGTLAQPNWWGIYVNGQAAQIGVATPTEWRPNLISGNSQANIYVNAGGADTVISGNYLGVDSSGVTPLPSSFGIYAIEVAGLRIGYAAADTAPERQRNVIAVSAPAQTSSIDLLFYSTIDNTAAGNYIGVGADGQTLVPIASGLAVSVYQSASTLVGCDGNTAPSLCRNVIANPTGFAVQNWEGSSNTAIVGNYIGVAADGTTTFGGSANTIGIELTGADALVSSNFITTGGLGIGIELSPNSVKVTPVFLNQTAAGPNGAVLDSSGNCLQGNGTAGVTVNIGANPTVMSTDFVANWWGAADGPAPNGTGDSASSNVNYTPFLTSPASVCAADAIFADGFETPTP